MLYFVLFYYILFCYILFSLKAFSFLIRDREVVDMSGMGCGEELRWVQREYKYNLRTRCHCHLRGLLLSSSSFPVLCELELAVSPQLYWLKSSLQADSNWLFLDSYRIYLLAWNSLWEFVVIFWFLNLWLVLSLAVYVKLSSLCISICLSLCLFLSLSNFLHWFLISYIASILCSQKSWAYSISDSFYKFFLCFITLAGPN